MQKRLLIATFVLCGVLLFVGLFPVHGEEQIYDTVVRLHVLANSDSDEDQALKLRVRDAVLEVTAPLLTDCKTQDEAKECLEAHADEIRAAAEGVIAAEGRTDTVSILLDREEIINVRVVGSYDHRLSVQHKPRVRKFTGLIYRFVYSFNRVMGVAVGIKNYLRCIKSLLVQLVQDLHEL